MRQWQKSAAAIAFAGATVASLGFAPGSAEAQGHGHKGHVPPGHLPPPGLCRVWYDDRPPGHQPEPTDCRRAERVAYETGGRVIYGDDARAERDDRDEDRDHDEHRCRDDDRRGDCGYYPAPTRYPTPYPTRYPSTLPQIVWAVIFGRGQRVDGVREWLGTDALRVKIDNYNRMLLPTIVSWYDGHGQLRQRWYDKNHDGHADRVEIYDGGRVVKTLR